MLVQRFLGNRDAGHGGREKWGIGDSRDRRGKEER